MSVSDGISAPDRRYNELLSTRKIQERTRTAIQLGGISSPVSDTPMHRDHWETGLSILAGQKDANHCVFRNLVTQRLLVET